MMIGASHRAWGRAYTRALAAVTLAAVLGSLMPLAVSATTCGFGTPITGGKCRGYLTSGSSWTVPSDWSSSNTIEAIGGGGGGSNSVAIGGGGGGGAYSFVQNVSTLSKGSTVLYAVGAGGAPDANGGDTYLCSNAYSCLTVVAAKGGGNGTTASGVGGSAAGGTGSIKYSGGSQGNYGSGGGAAGPNGNGVNAGAGDAGLGGAGGPGCGNGSNGTEWDSTHGTGGGGGYPISGDDDDGNPGCAGGNGGTYGGGGAGDGWDDDYGNLGGGTGGNGLIVIVYTPSVSANCTSVLTSAAGGSAFSIAAGVSSRLLNVFGYAQCISNSGSVNYFIPANTKAEVDSFFNAIPRLPGLSQQAQ